MDGNSLDSGGGITIHENQIKNKKTARSERNMLGITKIC